MIAGVVKIGLKFTVPAYINSALGPIGTQQANLYRLTSKIFPFAFELQWSGIQSFLTESLANCAVWISECVRR
jgi:hypothetical protein